MKTIDMGLFEGSKFCIKTKSLVNPEGEDYFIERIDAIDELKLMQHQEEISEKSTKWKTLKSSDIDNWKKLIIPIITKNNQDIEEEKIKSDIDTVRPMDLMGILISFIGFLNERSGIIFSGLADETKEEIQKIQNDVKKKKIENVL